MEQADAIVHWAADHDRRSLDELRYEARISVADSRGGHLLVAHDRADADGQRVIDEALTGSGDHVALIAELSGVPAGFALLRAESAGDGLVGVIVELFVSPWARELGVGEHLMDATVSWARDRGCDGIDAVALPGDRATKNFFESHGLVARAILVHRKFDAADAPPERIG